MKSKGSNSSELGGFKCFLIKVQPSILRVGAIKRKDWPNYLYLLITLSRNQGEALNLCRRTEHSNGILHTYLHPYHMLQCSTVTSNHGDEAVMGTAPAMPESRTCSPDHNMTEINVLQLGSAPPSSLSQPVLLSLIAPINPVSTSQGC